MNEAAENIPSIWEYWQFWQILSTIIAAFFGVLLASYLKYRWDKKAENDKRLQARMDFCAGLHAELWVLWRRLNSIRENYKNFCDEIDDDEIKKLPKFTWELGRIHDKKYMDGQIDKFGYLPREIIAPIIILNGRINAHNTKIDLILSQYPKLDDFVDISKDTLNAAIEQIDVLRTEISLLDLDIAELMSVEPHNFRLTA